MLEKAERNKVFREGWHGALALRGDRRVGAFLLTTPALSGVPRAAGEGQGQGRHPDRGGIGVLPPLRGGALDRRAIRPRGGHRAAAAQGPASPDREGQGPHGAARQGFSRRGRADRGHEAAQEGPRDLRLDRRGGDGRALRQRPLPHHPRFSRDGRRHRRPQGDRRAAARGPAPVGGSGPSQGRRGREGPREDRPVGLPRPRDAVELRGQDPLRARLGHQAQSPRRAPRAPGACSSPARRLASPPRRSSPSPGPAGTSRTPPSTSGPPAGGFGHVFRHHPQALRSLFWLFFAAYNLLTLFQYLHLRSYGRDCGKNVTRTTQPPHRRDARRTRLLASPGTAAEHAPDPREMGRAAAPATRPAHVVPRTRRRGPRAKTHRPSPAQPTDLLPQKHNTPRGTPSPPPQPPFMRNP